MRRHRRGGQAGRAQETRGAFPGDSQLLPGPVGIPSLNKGGSPGRALSALVRPWRPSQDGQKAQHTLRRTPGYPTPPNQYPRSPGYPRPSIPLESHAPRTPASPSVPGPHSQDGGLRRHGGHGLQQQMHAAHGGTEAQAAAWTACPLLGGDHRHGPPGEAQHERQQAAARGAHGHGRRRGRALARVDSSGGGLGGRVHRRLPTEPSGPRPTSQLCAGGGGAPAVHMRVAPPPLGLAEGGGWAIIRALVSEPSDPSRRYSQASLDCRISARRLHSGGVAGNRLEVQSRGLGQGLDP